MTKAEAVVWITEFLNRVDTQDRRATAHPIKFLLQRKREYVAHPDYTHQTDTVYRHPEMESPNCNTHEEAVAWLKDYGYKKELVVYREFPDGSDELGVLTYENGYFWVHVGCFSYYDYCYIIGPTDYSFTIIGEL